MLHETDKHAKTHVNGKMATPLKVIIVGAGIVPLSSNITCTYLTLTGIGGLTAAAGLQKKGHEVIVRLRNSETPVITDSKQLLERSQLAQESGAAMHLAPNCHGILKRFGIFPETVGANSTQGVGVIFF
jgi:hypothetical protein